MTTRAGCRSAANSQGRRSTLGVLRSTLPFWSVDAAKGNIPGGPIYMVIMPLKFPIDKTQVNIRL